jgi:hypothetical protein
MRKILVTVFMLFILIANAYEWIALFDDTSDTYDLYNSRLDDYIYASTAEGVKVFGGEESLTYNYAELDALGVAENNNDRFVIFGSGTYSDGLYTLDNSGNIELVDYYFQPQFLENGSYTNNIYFSSENNFQVNEANQWQIPSEFYAKNVTDFTESPTEQYAATDTGFYKKLAGETGLFANRQNFGTVQSNEINEASGLVASRFNPGVLWTHNDSGGGNFIFALNELGQHLGIYTITGTNNRDWEDIAIGNNPSSNEPEIYLADTGNNRLRNNTNYIYIIPEPQVAPTQDPVSINLELANTISFAYPNNEDYDSETLLFDSRTSTFYIITKRHPDSTEGYDKIFSLDYQISDEIQIATYEGNVQLPVDELVNQGATGGDISPDGNFILIKNYQNMYMWERKNMSIAQALAQPYIEVPYIMEPQGEAVAWRYDNNGYFTVSEEYGSIPAVLYFYSKKGWRKTSPLPIKKTEYNNLDGKLYGIINSDTENNGFWSSSDQGLSWEQINNYPNYSDLAVDSYGVIFLSHLATVIPEDWEKISAYSDGHFFDTSSGLENLIINKLVKNYIFDTSTVFACTNQGVFYIQDYEAVANESNDIEPTPIVSTYPNPFQQRVTISSAKGEISSGKVYNLRGQLIEDFSRDIKKGTEELVWKPHHSIPNGIYFIKIQTREGVFTSKVLKIN